MTYPASINSIGERSDGPSQIIYASYLNVIRTALLDLVTALGDAPQGNKSSIEARLDVSINDDGEFIGLPFTRIVAPSGAPYSTIQSAIDSVSGESGAQPYSVFVLPGSYTEKVTTKSHVHVIGLGFANSYNTDFLSYFSSKIIAPSGNSAIDLRGGSISNFYIESAQSQNAIVTSGSGGGGILNCNVKSTSSIALYLTQNNVFARLSSFLSQGYDSSAQFTSCSFHADLCTFKTEDAALVTLSTEAYFYSLYCTFISYYTAVNVPADNTFRARFCSWYNAPSGEGTIDLGTMSGSNSNLWEP